MTLAIVEFLNTEKEKEGKARKNEASTFKRLSLCVLKLQNV